MTSDREKNRVPGFPVGWGPRNGQHEEQHVLGFPASWFDNVNVDPLVWLVHAGAGRGAAPRILTSPAKTSGSWPTLSSGPRAGAYDRAVSQTWNPSAPGILRLPSGRLVRGRALSRPLPDGPVPAFGIYLLGRRPPGFPWESRWLRWPDFRLPADEADVLSALTEAWGRSSAGRVEIACAGGQGRTGTALACLAILDGVPGTEAVAFVREHYDPHAVETPGQRRYVARWPGNKRRREKRDLPAGDVRGRNGRFSVN